MGSLLTWTVTFLFTDIERCITLLQNVGDHRYAEALDEHQWFLRDGVRRR